MDPSPFESVPVELPELFVRKIDAFVDLMRSWSARVNLVSRRMTREHLVRHALGSLAALDLPSAAPADSKLRLLDIGSGGGFPAVALLLARPLWKGVLVEGTGTKCQFLREALEQLALEHAVVLHERYEQGEERRGPEAEAAGGPFDLVTLRALHPERRLVSRMAKRLAEDLAPEGTVVWYSPQDEPGKHLVMSALERLGLEHRRIVRVEWAQATLAIGRRAGVSRET